MEIAFGQEAYITQFDSFMRHQLTVKTREVPKINSVYDAFEKHEKEIIIEDSGSEALLPFVKNIHTYSGYYCNMNLAQEQNHQLQLVLRDLRE